MDIQGPVEKLLVVDTLHSPIKDTVSIPETAGFLHISTSLDRLATTYGNLATSALPEVNKVLGERTYHHQDLEKTRQRATQYFRDHVKFTFMPRKPLAAVESIQNDFFGAVVCGSDGRFDIVLDTQRIIDYLSRHSHGATKIGNFMIKDYDKQTEDEKIASVQQILNNSCLYEMAFILQQQTGIADKLKEQSAQLTETAKEKTALPILAVYGLAAANGILLNVTDLHSPLKFFTALAGGTSAGIAALHLLRRVTQHSFGNLSKMQIESLITPELEGNIPIKPLEFSYEAS